ncbi:MAG: hypothetical protein QOJ39_1479 [Candidatus Eremiobacteraeota bacterium]|nr:hypothetical protein [Candidatus Eremiobacteraeota bacterium]
MTLYTIGFTKTTAEEFFTRLRRANVKIVLDARLQRDGQLSGFAKVPDLPYFLDRLTGSAYEAVTALAPTASLLKPYRAKQLSWDEYAQAYRELLHERRPERGIDIALLDRACLLCSEHSPERCHRKIAAEYLRDAFAPLAQIEIVHL